MIEITELEMTCGSCPSQWEGKTADGREVYIRFRHGHLTAQIGVDVDEAILNPVLLSKTIGSPWDGTMDTDEMLQHLAPVARRAEDRPHVASRAQPPAEALAPEAPTRDRIIIENPASWPLTDHLPVKRTLPDGQIETGMIPAANRTAIQADWGFCAYESVEELLQMGWRVD